MPGTDGMAPREQEPTLWFEMIQAKNAAIKMADFVSVSVLGQILPFQHDAYGIMELAGCGEALFSLALLGAIPEEHRQGALALVAFNTPFGDLPSCNANLRKPGQTARGCDPVRSFSDIQKLAGPGFTLDSFLDRIKDGEDVWWRWARGVRMRHEEQKTAEQLQDWLREHGAPKTRRRLLADAGGPLVEEALDLNAESPLCEGMQEMFCQILAAREVCGIDYALASLAAGVPLDFVMEGA